jgi:hypothetical protein
MKMTNEYKNAGVSVKTALKSGAVDMFRHNHNQTAFAGMRVKSAVKAGAGWDRSHGGWD